MIEELEDLGQQLNGLEQELEQLEQLRLKLPYGSERDSLLQRYRAMKKQISKARKTIERSQRQHFEAAVKRDIEQLPKKGSWWKGKDAA
jgi:hypothetical protein